MGGALQLVGVAFVADLGGGVAIGSSGVEFPGVFVQAIDLELSSANKPGVAEGSDFPGVHELFFEACLLHRFAMVHTATPGGGKGV